MSDTDLITMEGDEGTIDVPADLAPTPPSAPEPPGEDTPAPAETAAAPPTPAPADDPEIDLDKETDPRVKGILGDLRTARKEAKAGRELAKALKGRPDILAALSQGTPFGVPMTPAPVAPTPVAPPVAPAQADLGLPPHELRDIAEEQGLYTSEGKPDLDAAQRFHARVERAASRVAERMVKERLAPIENRLVMDTAHARRTEALATLAQYDVDPGLASQVIDGMIASNPELLNDPQVAASSVIFAIGLGTVQKKHGGLPEATPPVAVAPVTPVARPSAPTYVEGATPRAAAPTMSALEVAMAKRVGAKPADWLAATSRLSNPAAKFFAMEDDE
jgi:hypothetical protein